MTVSTPISGSIRFAPWVDRRGRFHPVRAAVFTLLLVPALWLLGKWIIVGLGARPITAAIHSTGSTAVWLLLASLAITPAKAVLGLPNLVVVRRMIGNAALVYAASHLLLYCADEGWRPWVIASEIIRRFYLLIGFIAFLGLAVLGATSTDGWIRSMGRNWKRLHRIVYGLAALALFHYVLQTKLDVSQAMLAIGVFGWFMLWRAAPVGQDREWPALIAISVLAAAATLLAEYLWYRFGTRANVGRIIASEFDLTYGLHPAAQVLVAGLSVAGIAELCRIGNSSFGSRPGFTMAIYALGAFVGDIVGLMLAWPMSDGATLLPATLTELLWAMVLGILGLARWSLKSQWHRHAIDAVWIAFLCTQAVPFEMNAILVVVLAAATAIGAGFITAKAWHVSRNAALILAPVTCILGLRLIGLF